MSKRNPLLVMIAFCLLFASEARAQSGSDFTMVWRIVPQTELGEAKLFKSNDTVTRARIVPWKIVTTTAASLTTAGVEILPAGSQLAVLDGPFPVACNTFIANRSEVAGLPLGPPKNNYICLMDRNADGSFESFTRLRSLLMTAFVGVFRDPKPKGNLAPVRYQAGNPAVWLGREFAEFRYLGKTMGGTYRFGMTPIRENDNNVVFLHIRADQKVSEDSLPARFKAFGAEFEILGIEQGRPRMRAITPFPEQPFVIRGFGG